MEYEFIKDSLTGKFIAKFSMEHELMGPWLEVEVGKDITKIQRLSEIIKGSRELLHQDTVINGIEYTLIFTQDSVKVVANSQLESESKNEITEIEEDLHTDYDSSVECGIEDFEEILTDWLNFISQG